MTRDEFTSFTERTIENVIQAAEAKCGRKLSRDIRFQWLGHKPIEGNVVEELVSKVFVDSDHIYPCVDFGVGAVDQTGRTLLGANIAGYQPGPFGPNWTGHEGPYVYVAGASLLNNDAVENELPPGVFGLSILEFPDPPAR
jgi:hypothetical protein